jgi:hypothetical protein
METCTYFNEILIDINLTTIQSFQPSSRALRKKYEFLLLLSLHGSAGTGLSEAQFHGLFTKCRVCRTYMTRGSAQEHECPGRPKESAPAEVVIDLTGASGD